MKTGICCLLLLVVLPAFADEIVLKNGKVIEGTLLKEIGSTIIIQGVDGILLNIQREEIDQQKTEERKKAGPKEKVAASKPAKDPKKEKPPKQVSKQYLESLRDQYDLGEGSYGEAYELNLAEAAKYKDFSIKEDPDFERDVLRASGPVIVDFWAPWCGPCRAMAPHMTAVEKEFQDRAKIYRVNIDDQPAIAAFYQVHAIPTLVFFNNGEPVDRTIGFVSRDGIAARIEAILK